jgi:FixJ family two-component response regulator
MGALTQQGVRVEGCLNQLSVRINSLKGVTSGLQAQLSRLSSGQQIVIMTAGADVAVSPSRRSTTRSTSSSRAQM